jgi:hypothetical protein
LVCDSGVRKKPSDERGPKLIIAIRQPHATTTVGVRQSIDFTFSTVAGVDIQKNSGAGRRRTI